MGEFEMSACMLNQKHSRTGCFSLDAPMLQASLGGNLSDKDETDPRIQSSFYRPCES